MKIQRRRLAPPRRHAARPVFDSLEGRRLMARLELITPASLASVSVAAGPIEWPKSAAITLPPKVNALFDSSQDFPIQDSENFRQSVYVSGKAFSNTEARERYTRYSFGSEVVGASYYSRHATTSPEVTGTIDTVRLSYTFGSQKFLIAPEQGENVGDSITLKVLYEYDVYTWVAGSSRFTTTWAIDPGDGNPRTQSYVSRPGNGDAGDGDSDIISMEFATTIGSVIEIKLSGTGAFTAPPVRITPWSTNGGDYNRWAIIQDVAAMAYARMAIEMPRGLADLIPESLAWTNNGGVAASYKIADPGLTNPAHVGVYWSSTDRFADAIGGPIVLEKTPLTGGGAFTVPASKLQNPPPNAKFLLLVVDPLEEVAEKTEGAANTRPLPLLPDVKLDPETAIRWNPVDGGVFVDYSVLGLLKDNPTFDLYWSDAPAYQPGLKKAGSTTGGALSGGVQVMSLSNPPDGARYLVAYADPPDSANPDGKIKEASETNNVAWIVYDPVVTLSKVKYDGDSDEKKVGRFLPNPPKAARALIDDQVITATLSPSLAALKPTIVLAGRNAVGDGFEDVFTLIAAADGLTYETAGFDPTSIVFHDEQPFVDVRDLRLRANRLGASLVADEDQPAFSFVVMEKLPTWLDQISDLQGSVSVSPTYGLTYELTGMFSRMGLSDTMRIGDVPWLGEQAMTTQAGLGIILVVPLNPMADPVLGGTINLSFQLGEILKATVIDTNSITRLLKGNIGSIQQYEFSVNPTARLRPDTLDFGPDAVFGATFRFDLDTKLAALSPEFTWHLVSPTGIPYDLKFSWATSVVTSISATVFYVPGVGLQFGDDAKMTGGVKGVATGAVVLGVDLKSYVNGVSNNVKAFRSLLSRKGVLDGFFDAAATLTGQASLEFSAIAQGSFIGLGSNPRRLPGASFTITFNIVGELLLHLKFGDLIDFRENVKILGVQLLPGVFPLSKTYDLA